MCLCACVLVVCRGGGKLESKVCYTRHVAFSSVNVLQLHLYRSFKKRQSFTEHCSQCPSCFGE